MAPKGFASRVLIASLLGLVILLAACQGAEPTPTAHSGSADAATPAAQGEAPVPTAPSATAGTVEVRVTDKLPEGVSKVLVTASQIEAQRTGPDGNAGWSTILESPPVFDLIAVSGLEGVLGASLLPEGSYSQLRLAITKVVVTIDGKDTEAKVPSDRLKVVGGFKVEPGKTTVLTLDFDADRSVVIAGPNINFKPVVKLLVREPAEKPEPVKQAVLVVPLLEQNTSGQSGEAVLTAKGGKTEVVLTIEPPTFGLVQPVHVHTGTCDTLGGVVYALEGVLDGQSTTTLDVSLGRLRNGSYVINLHKSAGEIGVNVACGAIPAREAPPPSS